jgi:hypothetical protein
MVYRKVRSGATLMRLNERNADFLAIGYLAFWRFDLRSNDLRARLRSRLLLPSRCLKEILAFRG